MTWISDEDNPVELYMPIEEFRALPPMELLREFSAGLHKRGLTSYDATRSMGKVMHNLINIEGMTFDDAIEIVADGARKSEARGIQASKDRRARPKE